MTFSYQLKKFWEFLKKDTWGSWFVSLILIVIFIKLIFFPTLSFITGTPLPLVVIESCSMYHESSFNSWWNSNSNYYTNMNISKQQFENFPFHRGLNKGDIIFVWGHSNYEKGDIIIFNANQMYPIIHRIITESPTGTKGDHNGGQLSIEQSIPKDAIIGKSVVRIPYLGWVKLIFFDIFKTPDQRGLCK